MRVYSLVSCSSEHSHASFQQKRALLVSCLRKVDKMANNTTLLIESAKLKLDEFKKLFYPRRFLFAICTMMAHETGKNAWRIARSSI